MEALFRHLPTQHIYTMKITTPEAWNVQMHQTWADLDNIRLTNEGMGTHDAVKADFLLKNVLLAGHCQDKTHLKPPNGLQLVLQVRHIYVYTCTNAV